MRRGVIRLNIESQMLKLYERPQMLTDWGHKEVDTTTNLRNSSIYTFTLKY